MRFACLGSGSQGNGLVVEVANTRLLLDCGFTLKETLFRLSRLGLEPEMIDGLVVTHEHDDHIGGVERFARKFRTPVWLTYGTLRRVERRFARLSAVNIIEVSKSSLIRFRTMRTNLRNSYSGMADSD